MRWNWKPLCFEYPSFSFNSFFGKHTQFHTAMQSDTLMLMCCQCITPSDCVMHGRLLSFQPNFQLNVENVFPVTLGLVMVLFRATLFSEMKYSFIGEDSLRGGLSEMWIHGSRRHFFNICHQTSVSNTAQFFFSALSQLYALTAD